MERTGWIRVYWATCVCAADTGGQSFNASLHLPRGPLQVEASAVVVLLYDDTCWITGSKIRVSFLHLQQIRENVSRLLFGKDITRYSFNFFFLLVSNWTFVQMQKYLASTSSTSHLSAGNACSACLSHQKWNERSVSIYPGCVWHVLLLQHMLDPSNKHNSTLMHIWIPLNVLLPLHPPVPHRRR